HRLARLQQTSTDYLELWITPSSAPWIVGVPPPAARHMSVVPRANGGAASFPRRERFYMRWTEQEVNQIALVIDPSVEKSSRALEQSFSDLNQKQLKL